MPGDHTKPIAAIIVMGVSGSGKSTISESLARKLGFASEDGDLYHPKTNVEKMHGGIALTDEDRWPWLRTLAALIDRYAADGRPVVIACSALKRAYRDVLVHGRRDVRIVYLKGSPEVIASRTDHRTGHFMPPSLLASQLEALEEPTPDEHAITVGIDAPADTIANDIIRQLHLPASAGTQPT
ncbi:MAG TPA: gluconokinase [Afipia sp.]